MAGNRVTKGQALSRRRFFEALGALDAEGMALYDLKEQVPEAWRVLEDELEVTEKKVRVTLLLDASVAAFYRGMGRGYQARINRVLSAWAQFKIAEINGLWDLLEAEAPLGTAEIEDENDRRD